MARVLIIYPNTANIGTIPLAIAILSSIAKDVGCAVSYFETSFYRKRSQSDEGREESGEFRPANRSSHLQFLPYERMRIDFEERLAQFKPDILAVSANTPEYELFCELIEKVDLNRHGRPFVILGGVHSIISPEEVMKNPRVDALCIGEGEHCWREFLIQFLQKGSLEKIPNLWVRTPNGVIRNPRRALLSDEELWATPLDLSHFDQRHFLSPFDGVMYRRQQIELSRGCPFHCAYCVNSALKETYRGLGKFVRVRPLDNVKNAIRRLLHMGCDMLQFQDESFFSIPLQVLKAFCEWYASEVRLPMMIQARPECVDEDKVRLLAAMKIPVQMSLGIESGCPRILHEICKRKTSIEQVKTAFQVLKRYGIRTTAFTMIGFPTETRDEVFQTIQLVRDCEIDISVMSIFFPFDGTPLRKYCLERGFITGKERTISFTDNSVLKNQPMTPRQVQNLRRVYSLYTRLPQEYFSRIEQCENDPKKHHSDYQHLLHLATTEFYKPWKELAESYARHRR